MNLLRRHIGNTAVEIYQAEDDGAVGPLVKTFAGRTSRLRAWIWCAVRGDSQRKLNP